MDLKAIKTLLGEKRDYLEDMINNSPSCLKIIDKHGRLLSINCRGLDLVEAESIESVLGASVYDIIHTEDREIFKEFNGKICSGKRLGLKFRIIGLKGTQRHLESYAAPYKLMNGDLAHIAITNDITEVVSHSDLLRSQEKMILESSKLAALGKLAGNIAHELNNPLMIITGNARQISRSLESKEQINTKDIEQHAHRIQETVDRMSRIIRGLISFSHGGDEVDKRIVSIDELINQSISLCEERFKSLGITIESAPKSNLTVYACPVQLSQVLINLINNSFDAIENSEKKWIKIHNEQVNDKLVLSVTDSGPGIAPEQQSEIMTPFFTTKDEGKGTGLGLPISLGIIKSHGGDMYYNESSPCSQFVIELPLAELQDIRIIS